MTKFTLFLAGIPELPSDFESVQEFLKSSGTENLLTYKKPDQISSLSALIDDLESFLAKNVGTGQVVNVVGYSWGCFLISTWLPKTRFVPQYIIFVAPTLKVKEPTSPVVYALTGLPVVGKILIKKKVESIKDEYLQKSFSPSKAKSFLSDEDLQLLSQPETWQAALRYKRLMEDAETREQWNLPCERLTVIYGAEDTSVPPLSVEKSVEQMVGPTITKIKLENAGHALPWTHSKEIAELLIGIQNTEQVFGYFEGSDKRNNVISYMEDHGVKLTDRVAVYSPVAKEMTSGTALDHDAITYGQFNQLVSRAGKGLLECGVKKGDRVVVFLPMSIAMYTAMFAVQRIGAIAVFLDSWARSSHLGASLDCAEPTTMISHEKAFELVRPIKEFERVKIRIVAGPTKQKDYTARLEDLMKTKEPSEIASVKSEDTALITFTTGSSGNPKGANRTHRFLSAQCQALKSVIPFAENDIDMPAFPIFSLYNLASGVSTVLPNIDLAAPSKEDSRNIVDQIKALKISCTTLSPSMLNNLSKHCLSEDVVLDGLRRVVTGGAPISKDDVKAFKKIAPKTEIWILYGSTEVEPMSEIEAQDMLSYEADPDPEIVEPGVNVGHISEDLEYKFLKIECGIIDHVVDDWSQYEVAQGEVGEFIVSGDHVCRDYYNNKAAFKKSKIVDEQSKVWHRTGDLAFLDKNGYLWIVGRIHNAVKRQGKFYFPVQAEVILHRLSGVKRGAFLGISSEENNGSSQTAVVLQLSDKNRENTAVIHEAKRLFQKNKIPLDAIYVVEEIPMDPRHHSKVEYSVLKDKIASSDAQNLLLEV